MDFLQDLNNDLVVMSLYEPVYINLTNSGVLIITPAITVATSKLVAFSSLLTFKTNDRPSFQNVEVSKLECYSADETMTVTEHYDAPTITKIQHFQSVGGISDHIL